MKRPAGNQVSFLYLALDLPAYGVQVNTTFTFYQYWSPSHSLSLSLPHAQVRYQIKLTGVLLFGLLLFFVFAFCSSLYIFRFCNTFWYFSSFPRSLFFLISLPPPNPFLFLPASLFFRLFEFGFVFCFPLSPSCQFFSYISFFISSLLNSFLFFLRVMIFYIPFSFF